MLTSSGAAKASQIIPKIVRMCRAVCNPKGMGKALALATLWIGMASVLSASGLGAWSVDLLGFAGHVVHEEILAEGVGGGEIGFAAAHRCDFLDEVHEGIVAGEHEGVDHHAGALGLLDFFHRLAHDKVTES